MRLPCAAGGRSSAMELWGSAAACAATPSLLLPRPLSRRPPPVHAVSAAPDGRSQLKTLELPPFESSGERPAGECDTAGDGFLPEGEGEVAAPGQKTRARDLEAPAEGDGAAPGARRKEAGVGGGGGQRGEICGGAAIAVLEVGELGLRLDLEADVRVVGPQAGPRAHPMGGLSVGDRQRGGERGAPSGSCASAVRMRASPNCPPSYGQRSSSRMEAQGRPATWMPSATMVPPATAGPTKVPLGAGGEAECPHSVARESPQGQWRRQQGGRRRACSDRRVCPRRPCPRPCPCPCHPARGEHGGERATSRSAREPPR